MSNPIGERVAEIQATGSKERARDLVVFVITECSGNYDSAVACVKWCGGDVEAFQKLIPREEGLALDRQFYGMPR